MGHNEQGLFGIVNYAIMSYEDSTGTISGLAACRVVLGTTLCFWMVKMSGRVNGGGVVRERTEFHPTIIRHLATLLWHGMVLDHGRARRVKHAVRHSFLGEGLKWHRWLIFMTVSWGKVPYLGPGSCARRWRRNRGCTRRRCAREGPANERVVRHA